MGKMWRKKTEIERRKRREYFWRKSSLKPAHTLGMFIIMVVLATSKTKHKTITSIGEKATGNNREKKVPNKWMQRNKAQKMFAVYVSSARYSMFNALIAPCTCSVGKFSANFINKRTKNRQQNAKVVWYGDERYNQTESHPYGNQQPVKDKHFQKCRLWKHSLLYIIEMIIFSWSTHDSLVSLWSKRKKKTDGKSNEAAKIDKKKYMN